MVQEINLKNQKNLLNLAECDKKVHVLEGGSGSGKTYSIIYYLIWICQENEYAGLRITIARAKLTWLKASVLEDFLAVLRTLNIFQENDYNKSESIYNLYGNQIRFKGLDEPQKVHGPRQDITWINEAMEADYRSFTQLSMRTNHRIILDYNPSSTEHWIYDRVIPRDDCNHVTSTFHDNIHLPEEQRKEILGYEPTDINIRQGTADEDLWKIYGLGERADVKGLIFKNVRIVKEIPKTFKWSCNGLDYGYTNDPTAWEKVFFDNEIWVDEVIYQKELKNSEISSLAVDYGINKREEVIADSAEPKSNSELQAMGWMNLRGARKGPDSIKNGIDILKRTRINITERSIGMIRESRNYKWQQNSDVATSAETPYINKPIDAFNHGWDAVRYVALSKIGSPYPSGIKKGKPRF